MNMSQLGRANIQKTQLPLHALMTWTAQCHWMFMCTRYKASKRSWIMKIVTFAFCDLHSVIMPHEKAGSVSQRSVPCNVEYCPAVHWLHVDESTAPESSNIVIFVSFVSLQTPQWNILIQLWISAQSFGIHSTHHSLLSKFLLCNYYKQQNLGLLGKTNSKGSPWRACKTSVDRVT